MTKKELAEGIYAAGGSREAVNKLCATRINTIWSERGKSVNCRVETHQVWKGHTFFPMEILVSDTINGLPVDSPVRLSEWTA